MLLVQINTNLEGKIRLFWIKYLRSEPDTDMHDVKKIIFASFIQNFKHQWYYVLTLMLIKNSINKARRTSE